MRIECSASRIARNPESHVKPLNEGSESTSAICELRVKMQDYDE